MHFFFVSLGKGQSKSIGWVCDEKKKNCVNWLVDLEFIQFAGSDFPPYSKILPIFFLVSFQSSHVKWMTTFSHIYLKPVFCSLSTNEYGSVSITGRKPTGGWNSIFRYSIQIQNEIFQFSHRKEWKKKTKQKINTHGYGIAPYSR